jgi:hypothetical protein
MATFGGSNTVTDGLVLWLDAANRKSYPGSGNTWLDLSGNNYFSTLTNGPTYDSSNSGVLNFGNDSTKRFFYTTGQLGIPDNSVARPMSFGGWVNLNTQISSGEPFSSYYPFTKGVAEGSFSYYMTINAGPPIYLQVGRYGSIVGRNDFVIYNVTLAVGTWYYLFTTYDGSVIKLYINSLLVGQVNSTFTSTGVAAYSDTFGNGEGSNIGARNTKYKIGNVSFYNRALSAQEVRQNYDALKSRYLNIY